MNHAYHSGLFSKNNGEVFNFFNKDNGEKDERLYEAAKRMKPKHNTITIAAHGAPDKIIGPNGESMSAKDVHEYLLKNSKLYTGTWAPYLTIEIKACYAGTDYIYGFALNLSLFKPNSFVIGTDDLWWSDDTLNPYGKWNTFLNGELYSQSIFEVHHK